MPCDVRVLCPSVESVFFFFDAEIKATATCNRCFSVHSVFLSAKLNHLLENQGNGSAFIEPEGIQGATYHAGVIGR